MAGLGLVLAVAGSACAAPGAGSRPASPVSSPVSSTASSSAPSAASPAPSSPSASTRAPATPGPGYSTYPLGTRALPLREDGFGTVLPTPRTLRVRRYPTRDRLPPPPGGRWASSTGPVTPAIRERMGETWSPGCPVALADLRYVTVAFRGFDGAAHTGELVVAASQARGVVSVFRTLFGAGFPIEEMRLPGTADLEAAPTGDGNNTAALVCRAARGQTRWSAHAYGLAVDVNPFQNPYVDDDLVLPELASAYLDRGRVRPGMVQPDDVVVRAFARIGWSWGGEWSSLRDYQHFSALDR